MALLNRRIFVERGREFLEPIERLQCTLVIAGVVRQLPLRLCEPVERRSPSSPELPGGMSSGDSAKANLSQIPGIA